MGMQGCRVVLVSYVDELSAGSFVAKLFDELLSSVNQDGGQSQRLIVSREAFRNPGYLLGYIWTEVSPLSPSVIVFSPDINNAAGEMKLSVKQAFEVITCDNSKSVEENLSELKSRISEGRDNINLK